MNPEIFLAKRYLKPDRSAVGVITIISIIGVALGVAVLMIVLAVMTGFTDLMREKLLDTQSHIQVTNSFSETIRRPQFVMDEMKKNNIKPAAVIASPALAQINKYLDPAIYVMGINQKEIAANMKLNSVLKYGSFDLQKGEIVISSTMSYRWNIFINDKILLHSPKKLTDMVKINSNGKVELNEDNPIYLPSEFTVKGIYSFNKSDFDSKVVFVNINDAATLFDYRLGSATTIFGWVKNPYDMKDDLQALNSVKKYGYDVKSWEDMNSALLGVLAVEKRMMFFLLIFITLVAAFSITNTLITSVYKKTREIGILKAIGASNVGCMRIFVYQGMFVGIIGSIVGVSIGYLVIHFRNNILDFCSKVTGQNLFPKEFYYFDGLPAKIIASDVIIIVVISIILCTIGGIIPAIRAAKLDPAKALRYE